MDNGKGYKTIVLGASTNPSRYSYSAVTKLNNAGYEVIPLGIKEGVIEGVPIVTERPFFDDVHTITIYLSAERQHGNYDYILSLRPKRIIFNPGAENPELFRLAAENGIMCRNECTLVLLNIGAYEIMEI